MPAAVESMMYAKEVPWHGLGHFVGDSPVLSEEAIQASGLDWKVKKVPAIGLLTDEEGLHGEKGGLHECLTPDWYFNVRTSDLSVLGAVQGRYEVLQNQEAFQFMDNLAGPKNLVRYHTAGSLHGGKRIWLLAEVVGLTIEPVPGDPTTPYILLCNGHDGRMPLKALFTSVRVVCQNTLNLALSTAKNGVTIRHTSGMKEKVQEAKKVLGFANTEIHRYKELADRLIAKAMNDQKFETFLDELLPVDPDAPNPRRVNVRDQITELWHAGPGTDIVGVEGTAWNALQAVTNYNTHHRATRSKGDEMRARTNRLESSWFGPGNNMNRTALDLLTA